ncbi:Tetratricopeptide repeat-containing protein [Azospirillum oryzae]|uniref:Tetratricopeptide repeat-containing protein n=1 Tax=Azospirillum oryzae TaxID=286727 RepID=A0A1X7G9Z4_9PROT|nr:tetratricopeptide repeat protein [Azospirillum oryzae]SMF65802.1 Tetratricopeptide repeat-containing protein [Azospirillum oryzae]
MRVRFLHYPDAIVHEEANGRRTAPRSLVAGDRSRIGDWLTRYSDILEKDAAKDHGEAELLALGREIADWLDGPERWLSSLLHSIAARPLEVEFVAESLEQDGASDFLSLPWEILATAKGFLAADPTLGFCPIRRVGVAQAPRPPSDDHALTILFLSASPEGESELWVEAEEAAILNSAGRLPLDLVVEDGGTLDDLCERLSLEWPVEVLHLSCHGLAGRDGRPPMLALENELGHCAEVAPTALLDALGYDRRPRLLFLSACETAAQAGGVDPFILPMMAAGQPAAIGWAGSVYDSNASAFASALYNRIARGETLESAVAVARRALLAPPDGQERLPHWHLARLFLCGDGGGALCQPKARQRQREFKQVESRFLGGNRQVSVVGRTGFVGRRRELQRALRVLRDRPAGCAGLLLHGAGHLGKSSLAARIADRMTEHEPAVVYGACDIDSVLSALAVARPGFDDRLALDPAALRGRPDQIYAAMRRVLDDSLRDRPVLLVLDDFEQCLDLSATGRPTVKVEVLPVLQELLRAFADSSGGSALLVTCRYRFALADRLKGALDDIPLHPFDAGTRLKQALTRLRDQKAGEVGDDLLERCLEAGRGNPGLQELLITLALSAPDKAERAVAALDSWLMGIERPDDAKSAAQLDHLMLDTLWDCVDAEGQRLLRVADTFELPLPLPALSALARHIGMSDTALDRLLSLSVFDLFSDVVEQDRPAAAPCHLLAPRIAALGALSEADASDFARALLPALFVEWGEDDHRKRPYEADVMLTELAVRAEDAMVLRVTALDAVYHLLRTHRYRRAVELGRRAVAMIESSGFSPPLQLLRRTAQAAALTGDVRFARKCLGQAVDMLAAAPDADPKDVGSIRTEYARLLVQDGKPDQALEIFTDTLKLYQELGDVRSRAVTLGDIARLKAGRGLVDEALALHEEMLAIFGDLGDVRSRAVLLGDIARLKADRGFVDEALALHEERLAIFGDLGEVRSRAVTLGDIACLKADRGFVDEALALHEERLAIFGDLGDVRERAVTLGDIARLKAGRGFVDEALALHEERLEIFGDLGEVRSRAVTLGDIARLKAGRGLVDEALALHEEQLAIFSDLGDVRERAVTLGDIARLKAGRGFVDEALALYQELLAICEKLGDLDGQANCRWSRAMLHLRKPSIGGDEFNAAFDDLAIAYRILKQTGRVDGIAAVGLDLARVLARIGGYEKARELAEQSLALFTQIRWPDASNAVREFIASLPPPSPEAPAP